MPRNEEPRAFQFGVTWSSLTVGLELKETTGRNYPTEPPRNRQPLAALTAPAPLPPPPETESTGRWEMVVPKMVRNGRQALLPANSYSPPATAAYAAPLFSRPTFGNVFSMIGRRTRALVAGSYGGPPFLAAERPTQHQINVPQAADAARELLLSKIVKALRTRPAGDSIFAAERRQEP